MKKSALILATCPLIIAGLSGCSNSPYTDKIVGIFREKDIVDKQISLRFYAKYKHVPYIAVNEYYKEFFNDSFTIEKDQSGYKYSLANGEYLYFDVVKNSITCSDLNVLSEHKDFVSSTGKLYLRTDETVKTEKTPKTIELSKYNIEIKDEKEEVYAPFSLLSKYFGGTALYNAVYNGKDIYVLDLDASLSEEERDTDYYGKKYAKPLNNLFTRRPKDIAEYTYNELCMVFDNFRGETKQLIFGDEKLQSLGLDGLLTKYHPEMKEFLLHANKLKYYKGLFGLFSGLYDGGHTGILTAFTALYASMVLYNKKSDIQTPIRESLIEYDKKDNILGSYINARKNAVNIPDGNYYVYDGENKTALIGFDEFSVDYTGWDDFYNGKGEVPVNSDAYAYIRDKLYKAKRDGAENVVIDVTTNGGGNTDALNGIIGLLNHAKSNFIMYDSFTNNTTTDCYSVDINLDGKFDELDVEEANSFDFNVGILTSPYSFSCANLFPSRLKEMGFKIIGQQSGGGSCAISVEATADGVSYVRSSHLCLYNEAGENIDGGVPVDYEIKTPEISDDGHVDATNIYNFAELANAFR